MILVLSSLLGMTVLKSCFLLLFTVRRFFQVSMVWILFFSNAYQPAALPVYLGKCGEHEVWLLHYYAGVTHIRPILRSLSLGLCADVRLIAAGCPKQDVFGSGHTVQQLRNTFSDFFDLGFLLITLFISNLPFRYLPSSLFFSYRLALVKGKWQMMGRYKVLLI